MASFGAGAPANATIAFSLLGDNVISAGYTPASALGEFGILAAVVASMIGDSLPATAITVGGGTQLTKVVVYSITIPVTTASTNSFLEASVAVTGVVTSDKIAIYPTVAPASAAIIMAAGRCSVTDQVLFTVYAGNTTAVNTSGVYRIVAIRS